MRALVTGGLGTIGAPLVRELEARGVETWACDLPHSHLPRYVRCDVGSASQLARLFEHGPFDLVYHLAAEFGRWNGEDYYEALWRTNVIGTKHLIRLQEAHGFRMVFASSSEVYGDHSGLMTEEVMDTHETRQLNDYALSKWVNEQQIMNSAAMHGTHTVRVRLFNTYGPGEYYTPYRSVVCRFIYAALFDQPFTVYTAHRRTSTYATDTVRTLANIAGNFHPGEVYNVGGSQFHDMRTLSDLVLASVGRTDKKVTYRDAEPFTTRDKDVSVEKAERVLGHCATVPLEEGIPHTVAWMRSVYGDAENPSAEAQRLGAWWPRGTR